MNKTVDRDQEEKSRWSLPRWGGGAVRRIPRIESSGGRVSHWHGAFGPSSWKGWARHEGPCS